MTWPSRTQEVPGIYVRYLFFNVHSNCVKRFIANCTCTTNFFVSEKKKMRPIKIFVRMFRSNKIILQHLHEIWHTLKIVYECINFAVNPLMWIDLMSLWMRCQKNAESRLIYFVVNRFWWKLHVASSSLILNKFE